MPFISKWHHFGPVFARFCNHRVSKTTMKAQVKSINQVLTTWSARQFKVLGLTTVAVI